MKMLDAHFKVWQKQIPEQFLQNHQFYSLIENISENYFSFEIQVMKKNLCLHHSIVNNMGGFAFGYSSYCTYIRPCNKT